MRERLLQTVKTMREAADNAERAVKELEDGRYPRTPLEAIAKVQHSLTWGMANAWSSTENALMRIQDHEERQKYAAERIT